MFPSLVLPAPLTSLTHAVRDSIITIIGRVNHVCVRIRHENLGDLSRLSHTMSEGAPAAKRAKTDGDGEMPPSIVADMSLAAEGEQLIELAEPNM
jgi:hypothetical protein